MLHILVSRVRLAGFAGSADRLIRSADDLEQGKHRTSVTPALPLHRSRCLSFGSIGAASLRTPKEEGSPRVLRSKANQLSPRSGIRRIFLSDASRTSPTVLRPAAVSACFSFGGSSTFAMDMSSGSSGDGSIMASLFPLTAVILSARKASFGGALKARQRVPRACVEPLVDQDPHQRASPSLEKSKSQ